MGRRLLEGEVYALQQFVSAQQLGHDDDIPNLTVTHMFSQRLLIGYAIFGYYLLANDISDEKIWQLGEKMSKMALSMKSCGGVWKVI